MVETIIYATGAALLLGVIVGALFYIFGWYSSAVTPSRADQVAQSVATRLAADLRAGMTPNLASSTFNVSNGAIALTVKLSATTTKSRRYALENGRITFKEDALPKQFISPTDTYFSRFQFSQATSTASSGVRYSFDVSYRMKTGTTTSTYSGFAIFRNSYK